MIVKSFQIGAGSLPKAMQAKYKNKHEQNAFGKDFETKRNQQSLLKWTVAYLFGILLGSFFEAVSGKPPDPPKSTQNHRKNNLIVSPPIGLFQLFAYAWMCSTWREDPARFTSLGDFLGP